MNLNVNNIFQISTFKIKNITSDLFFVKHKKEGKYHTHTQTHAHLQAYSGRFCLVVKMPVV